MEKKKLYVLTGFLGAGKTTLLMYLLDNMADRKIGIIQNEFGKLDIDGERLQRDGISMTEIGRGSIFCSCLKLTFVQALAEMGKQDLEYVFVESSGLADPSNIEEILLAVKELAGDVYDFKGVICLVDGIHFMEQVKDTETVDRQLAHCHMAAVNKVDMIADEQLERVIEEVRRVNPVCELVTCVNGAIGMDFLEQDLMARKWAESEESTNTVDNKPKTFSIEFDGVLEQEKLMTFLQGVLPECYRIKGFFRLDEGWRQIDVVEKQIDIKPCQPRDKSQLVFLSKVGPQVIRTVDRVWKENIEQEVKLKN